MVTTFDEVCVHCGRAVKEISVNGGHATQEPIRRVLIHADNGMIHCPNLAGTIACLPNGGVE